jgi:hypothetical protein
MTEKPENHSGAQGSGEGSASETESARLQREAFERLCEKIQSAMSGWRPPECCIPPDYCAPPYGHHHHYCGPPPPYCGPPPSLSLLNHMFQFAGARAHFWHRWFESLAYTAYRSQPSYYWHDPYCYGHGHGHWHDPCCSTHELADHEEFADVKKAMKDFVGQLDDEQKKKYEPALCEMLHCVSVMRRMDAMRRKSYGHPRSTGGGPAWN